MLHVAVVNPQSKSDEFSLAASQDLNFSQLWGNRTGFEIRVSAGLFPLCE
jgi:hypothetical protein